MRAVRISMWATVAVAIITAAVLLALDWDWMTAAAWVLVALWAGYSLVLESRADRMATAYTLAAGRNASAYARGYRDGAHGDTFHAGRD